jgi:hypothetical protein
MATSLVAVRNGRKAAPPNLLQLVRMAEKGGVKIGLGGMTRVVMIGFQEARYSGGRWQ